MPGHLGLLPRRQLGICVHKHLGRALFKLVDLIADIDVAGASRSAQFDDTRL